jgi:transposase-like protein
MSYIYPECPSCDNKASKENGVSLREAIQVTFEWKCPECDTIHEGSFNPPATSVNWHDSRPTYRRRVRELIEEHKPTLDRLK